MRIRVAGLALAIVLLGVVGLWAACSVGTAHMVDGRGGRIEFPDAGGVAVVVPRGAVSAPTQMSAGIVDHPPGPTFGAGVDPLGPAYQITSEAPLPGARITVPVDPTQTGPSGRSDFFLAVYSDSLATWVPVATDYDPNAESASAVAPHFSMYQLFRYGVGQLDGAISWAGTNAGGFLHDAWGGVKAFASGVAHGVSSWWDGPSLKEPDCKDQDASWTVAPDATEVNGCVAGGTDPELRLGNTYRVPFDIAVPNQFDIGPRESDSDLDLIDLLMRGASHTAGRGYVAARGTTSVGISDEAQTAGSFRTRFYPDQLGTALGVVASLLSFLPERAVFTETVERDVVIEVLDAAHPGESTEQLLGTVRSTVTRTIERGPQLTAAETFLDDAGCVTKKIEAGLGAVVNADPGKMAESLVDVAKECTGAALEKQESAFKEAWEFVKTTLDSVQAVREVIDAVKLGFTHLGGQFNVDAQRVDPVLLSADQEPGYVTTGLGESRPTAVDFGGDGNGVVTDIVWDSWGGAQASGHGTAGWVPPGQPLSDAVDQQTQVVAYDLGTCNGRPAYRSVLWFFPEHGETFDEAKAKQGGYPSPGTCSQPR